MSHPNCIYMVRGTVQQNLHFIWRFKAAALDSSASSETRGERFLVARMPLGNQSEVPVLDCCVLEGIIARFRETVCRNKNRNKAPPCDAMIFLIFFPVIFPISIAYFLLVYASHFVCGSYKVIHTVDVGST